MVYTNTVQRTMIWGLVGLLVVSALPLNSAFAQTSDTTKPVIASVAKVLTSDNKNQLYINYTPIEELSPRVYVQYATTVDGVASAGAIPYASGEVIVIPKPNYPTLTSGARYYFRVQAVDAANNYSDWYPTTSNQASSYFDVPNTKPSAPAWMSLTYYSESQFFASLPQRSDNTQYHLRYRASGPITNLTEYTSTSNEQSFSAQSGETIVTVPDAMKGGMIYGAVRACNPAPDNCSDAVTAGQVLIGAPTAPASLTATLDAAAPNTTVKLSWTVPTSKIGTHQTIKRRTTTNPAAWTEAEWDSADYVTQVNLPSTDAGMAKTFTVSTGLTSGSTYVFGIRGYTSSHITAPKSAIVVTSPVTLVAPTPTPTPTPSPTSTPGASAPEPLNDESGVWAQVDIASGQVLSSAICKKSVCGINGEYHGYVPPASYTTGSVWWPTSKRYIWQLPGQAGYGSGTFNFSTYVFTVTGGTIYNGVFTSTPASTPTPNPTPTATVSPTPTPSPSAPVLSSIVHAVNAGGSATITWNTNVPATSIVHYSADPAATLSPGEATKQVYEDATLVAAHSVTLNALDKTKTYKYKVISAANGMSSESAVSSFYAGTVTAAPPTVFNVYHESISESGVTIRFTSSVNAIGQVEWADNAAFAANTVRYSSWEAVYSTNHIIGIGGLTSLTKYYFRARVKDASSVYGPYSETLSFTTAAVPPGPTQCNDGQDNDGDGLTDFPSDTGCYSASDNDETIPTPTPGTFPTGSSSAKVIVKDYTGAFVHAARITFCTSSNGCLTGYSNEFGLYEFANIAAGTYLVGVDTPSNATLNFVKDYSVTVPAAPGMEFPVTLSQKIGGTPTPIPGDTGSIMGTVFESCPACFGPLYVPTIGVMAFHSDGRSWTASTNAQGEFRFSDIPVGTYKMFVFEEQQRGYNESIDAQVTVAKGLVTQQSFTLTRASVTPSLTILKIEPAYGPIGTEMRIVGTGFLPAANALNFGGGYMPNLVPVNDGNTLVFTVPEYTSLACHYNTQYPCVVSPFRIQPGVYTVTVKNANGRSNEMSFTVTKPGEVQPIEPPPPPGQPCDLPKGIGRIEGFVKGEDGAIANIGVRLTHPTGCHRINFTVKTGWFIFDNIGAGLYGIEVVDAEARGYTKSGHPAIDLREGGKHVAYIGIGKLYSGPPTEPIVCPTYIRAEEVCGQVGEKLVTFNSPCELRQARAQYFYHGRCKTTPDIIEKICPQVWEPVCGKDGQTYSNKCYADGVTEIAFAGTCEKPKPGPLPEPIDGDDENSDILKGIPHFIAMVQERLAQLAQYVGTVADPKEQASAATLQGDVAGQLKELLEAVGNQDVSRIKLLGTKLDRVLHAIEEKISGFTKKYTKDIIRNSTRVSKALVKRYAAPAPEDEGSLFGDDITHLRVKAEKQAAILERAQRAFERGDKKLAQSLVRDAEATFGADEYGATGDAKYVEAPGLEKVLADVRNGLNAAWEGVSAAKERGIEADPLLLALLQKAETVYQQAVTALKNGKPEEVGPLLGSLKSLGLQEKFVNFRGGSGRPELAQSRWEDILADAEKSRSYVAKGIPELARRGGDTTGLTEILARLTKLITEARRAFAAEDKRLGFQLVDEIAAMDVQQVLADIFRNLGHDDFKGEISETLREAPNYIAAMSKVIENLRDRGEDVAMYENLLAAAEAARVKGQAAVDAGDAKGAEEAVQRMFGPAMKLYNLLGAQNVERVLSRKERKIVGEAFTVDVKNIASVELLGKKRAREVEQFVASVSADITDTAAIAGTLSTLPADIVAKMLEVKQKYEKELRGIFGTIGSLPPEFRAEMITSNVEIFDELKQFDAARKVAAKVKGISRASLEQIDALKAKLSAFNFPEDIGGLVAKRMETFADTIRGGTITDVDELEGYVGTFRKDIDQHIKSAIREKFKKGMIPAMNIDDTSEFYGAAMALKEADALTPLVKKNGEVSLAAAVNGSVLEKVIEGAVDANVIQGAAARKLKKLKTVRGIDGVKYIFDAYNVDVPAATLNNSNRLDDYLKTEFGVTMTTAELQKPLTAEDLIALVGHAEEEYGVDEDLEIVE